MNSESNIFQKIINGEIPCTKIYEDTDVLAFLDIHPNNLGHTLVIPKKHSKNIFDIETEDLEKIIVVAQKVAKAIKSGLGADGVKITINNNIGQDVFHTHIHVIPRFENDGWQTGRHLSYKEGEAEKVAEKIRSNI